MTNLKFHWLNGHLNEGLDGLCRCDDNSVEMAFGKSGRTMMRHSEDMIDGKLEYFVFELTHAIGARKVARYWPLIRMLILCCTSVSFTLKKRSFPLPRIATVCHLKHGNSVSFRVWSSATIVPLEIYWDSLVRLRETESQIETQCFSVISGRCA